MEGARAALVGRDEELDRLCAAILSGRPVAVVGEAGIGKTTLVRAAAVAVDAPIHEGGGFATLVAMPYLALRRAVAGDLAGDPARVAELVERRIGPDLLFIDDLQWVDADSLRVVASLAERILFVTAIRTGDPRASMAGRIAEAVGAELIALGRLDDDAAPVIVRRVRPDLPDAVVARVVARAGGNPLVLEEMALHGAASPVLAKALTSSLETLSTDGLEVVTLLSIADRPLPREGLGPSVEEPLRHGSVIDRAGRVEVRHALLAEAVRSRLDDQERGAMHRRIAGLVDDPVEAARHLVAGGDVTGARVAALAALPGTADPMKRASLLAVLAETSGGGDLAPKVEAGQALAELSRWDDVVAILAADPHDAPVDLRAERAALLAHASHALGQHDAARALLAEAAGLPIRPAGPAAAHLAVETAAFMVNVDGDIGGALARLDEVLAGPLGSSPQAVQVRIIREAIGLLAVQDADTGLLGAAVDAALAAGAFASAADLARVVSVGLLMWSGAEADLAFLETTGPRFDAAGVAEVGLELLAERVKAAVLGGRLDDAVAFADEILERPAPLRAWQTAAIYRAKALGLMGRLDEAEDALRDLGGRVTDDFVGRGEWLATRAELALWGGRAARAVELASQVRTIPSPILNAYGLPDLTRAWARFELGLDPGPIDGVLPTHIMAGAIPEAAALECLHAGQPDAAAASFADATARWRSFHEPRAMFCAWAEGEALRRAGRDDEMATRLGGVLEEASARGDAIVAQRARRSLRRAGRRVPVSRSASDGGRRLTARERELLELVERGLTNIEIARRMGLGRPTVSRILSNAMTKLDATTRAQAVVLATERDRPDDDDRGATGR